MSDPVSLAELRDAWKPLNEIHRSGRRYSDGVHLRIYRCLSWADRAEIVAGSDEDLAFILRTIGFNALWGQEYRPGEERPSQLGECTRFLLEVSAVAPQDRLLGWMCGAAPLLDGIANSGASPDPRISEARNGSPRSSGDGDVIDGENACSRNSFEECFCFAAN